MLIALRSARIAPLVVLALLAGHLALRAASHPVLIVVALPMGLAVADLVSGRVHWFCDTFLDARAPWIGPAFISPFREHHHDPSALLEHDFLERNASNAMAAIPIALLGEIAELPFVSLLALATAVAVLATNQIHAWAHCAEPPRVVRALQSMGLVLSPEAHAAHHRCEASAYCVTTGWLNPLVDRSGALRACTALLTRLGVPRGVS